MSRPTRRSMLACAAALATTAAGLMLALAAGASAKTFVVTKRADPVPDACKKRDCSLREAVLAANARPGKDVIELPNRRRPYNLARAGSDEDGALDGDLDIANHALVVKHPGKGRATVDANGIERVFEVFAGAPTTFRKLVIRGGNNATSGSEGGGIRSEANLRVIRSRIVGNESDSSHGGGIGLQSGAGLTLVRSVVRGNRAPIHDGGGIDGDQGPMVVVRSVIAQNTAGDDGGGIYFLSDDGSRIEKSTIAGNRAEGDAGGINVTGGATDSGLRLIGSTVSRNRSAVNGGGITVHSPLRVTNSTLASNRADGSGGGIYYGISDPMVKLNGVTVARNVADADADATGAGGGLYRASMNGVLDAFAVENSLLGLNRLGSGQRNDCDGLAIDSLGHNLVSTLGPAGACQRFGPPAPKDIVNKNPRIGKLKRNGGPTQTIALRKRSPAINKAKRSTAPKRDQRGVKRKRKRDIGAYERNVNR